MATIHWNRCADTLQQELSEQQFNTWIRPLKPIEQGSELQLVAPNRFIRNWVEDKFLTLIRDVSIQFEDAPRSIRLILSEDLGASGVAPRSPADQMPQHRSAHYEAKPGHSVTSNNDQYSSSQPVVSGAAINGDYPVRGFPQSGAERSGAYNFNPELNGASAGNQSSRSHSARNSTATNNLARRVSPTPASMQINRRGGKAVSDDNDLGNHTSALDRLFTFESFVEGKSNQLALAAAKQVADNPGSGYNPLFIYGGVGLGKTHLMHAVGNELVKANPNAKVAYLHSERFVADMVKALQLNAINDFKRYYRSADALLIDDIQFFAKKERSQEEFFHTFNSLMERGQQMIFTCDRYPKEIDGLEERLKSRFGWGLTASVEPPELETRAAILMKKAEQTGQELSSEAAVFIAQRVRSNVRELEGALKRVIASAHFTGEPISIELIKESLKDLLALQERLVTVDNIQREVADYYNIKLADLLSKKRTRSLARPRQVAMSLAKQLTNRSLPEIGDAFGGRDHTTVLHACRKVKDLEASDGSIREDLKNLNRILST